MAAPVIHWAHSPGSITTSDGDPAELMLTIFNSIGFFWDAPIVSAAQTANPSMAELSNRGDGMDAATSSVRIRPLESFNATDSFPN